jgi:hypothetical protein
MAAFHLNDRRATKKMPYDITEHRHRFAVWAAARAAQRGFTTVRNLRDALQATNIREVLSAPSTLDLSAAQFDELHRRWCSAICSSLIDRQISKATYGRAAKLVAIYLKAIVVMGGGYNSSFARHMHPPIDRILLQSLATSDRITSPHKAAWRSTSWTQLDEGAYDRLIGQLRAAIPANAPFWMIEEYCTRPAPVEP